MLPRKAKRSPFSSYVGARFEQPEVELDDKDLSLLRELAKDSRQSQRALSRSVGMSPPAVAERLARFERTGIVRQYSVSIDWNKLGLGVVALVNVTLKPGCDRQEVFDALAGMVELEQLTIVTGRYDLAARFRISDQAHLRELILDRVPTLPGILRTETLLGLGTLDTEDFASRMFDAFPGDECVERAV
ncbi:MULTISPECIES: Lrp/AsnC family transcriptional regulator [Subtercola]|uniref:DNA-binding Lrp family transcriptional regulator n=1 Tax=Subtercola frigoramans TaxID=120298 RepID=A0ABS2L4J6_9MICO|nr:MULTISPECIES: Lrp/AsnC family transcriptional regulator [Subtercola]MBM7471376.1 DNA-binding Lrp family transcriptional regulator [Subtercola frigoramans]QWT24015.1 Lrp/AsnC family transcriptional regulator [Subtercola sp. PAMC28395]